MFSLVAEQQLSTFDIMEELLRDQRTKFSILAGQVLCLSLMPVFVFLFECFLLFYVFFMWPFYDTGVCVSV